MGLTLDDLFTVQTKEQVRADLLNAAAGLGAPQNLGNGSGIVTLSGTPRGTYAVVVNITAITTGTAVTFIYSLDGGLTFSGASSPSLGAFVLPGTGLTLNFVAPTSSAFQVGDVFTVNSFAPPLPVTAWQPGDTALVLLEVFAATLVILKNIIRKIAGGGLLKFSSGAWLTILADNLYDCQRATGQVAMGYVTLADVFSAGPFSITPDSLLFQTASGLRYRSAQSATLTMGSTLSLLVKAESPGPQYNVGGQAITIMGTPLPGVTVTNAINWITQQGTNDETDPDLIARCIGKWSSLAFALPGDAYAYWAKQAAPGTVTRAQSVVDSDPTHPGRVLLYVAGSSGPVAGSVVTAVQTAVFPRVPLTGDLLTISAPVNTLTLTGSVYNLASFNDTIVLAVETAIIAFFSTIPVGGVVYFSQLVAAIQNVPGVREVVLTFPLADTALTIGQVAAFVDGLTYVGV